MISVIGIIIAVALLIYFAMKGYNILVITPLLAMLVALASKINFIDILTGPFMTSFMDFAGNFFLVFLFGAIFGKIFEDSGAATSIAQGILKVTGTNSRPVVIIAMVSIVGLLTYGGISVFVVVFAILPIARPLFKQLDIPWSLFPGVLFFGAATFTMTFLPGAPTIQNVIPTRYLDTTVTAAPVVGFVATIILVPLGLWWLIKEDKKYHAKGLGYEETKGTITEEDEEKLKLRENVPHFFISLLPILVLLIALIGFKASIELSLLIGIILALLLFFKDLKSPIETLNQGAINVSGPILYACAVVGFGGAVAATSGFEILQTAALNIPGHPLISFAVAINVLVGVTASSSGGLGIGMEVLSQQYAGLVDPEALHRIATVSSSGFDALPHNGAIIAALLVSGLTHKEAYRPIFWLCVLLPLVAIAGAIITAIFIYG